jgi:glycosyltransferase involved in cell wall biosynthesis
MAAELGRPSIWIVRESESPESYFHSRWPTAIAERALAALSLADRVVFVAEATRELFEDRLEPGTLCSIPNGLDLSRFDLAGVPRHRAEIRRGLKLAEETPLLLCVGTPCMRKGQLELIRALGILRDTRPDFHCVFLGMVEGDYLVAMRDTIEELGLADRVTLQTPVLDARSFFAAADVALCPSFQESLPRVVLEAMGFAKPILATRVFGIPELVRDEVDGILVEPGDVESMAKGIDRLLADPKLASRFGASARRRAESHFSLARCVQGYTELLDEVLAGRGGASR